MLKIFKIVPGKVKLYFFIGVFLLLINVVTSLLVPMFMSQFIKLIAQGSNSKSADIVLFQKFIIFRGQYDQTIKALIILTLSTVIISFITSLASIIITTWAGNETTNFLRDKLYKKMQKFSLKDIASISQESLITRVSNDVAQYWDFLISSTSTLVRAPLLIIGGTVFALLTDMTLSVSILVIVPILIGLIAFIMIKAAPLMKKNQVVLDEITKEVDENILAARLIKIYNLKDMQEKKFTSTNDKWLKLQVKSNNIFAIGHPFFFALINVVLVLIYALAGIKIWNGFDDYNYLATINIFIEYMFLISFGIVLLSQYLIVFYRAKVSCGRINQVLDFKFTNLFVEDGEYLDKDNKKGYSIEFKDLNFKYFDTSKEKALSDINFKLLPGQTLGIIGPTGSGKSTIANLLVNNFEYKNGSIRIDNKEVNKINSKSLHENVGIVYQEAMLYSGTIRSNLMFAKSDASIDEINKAMRVSCAIDFIQTFEDRLEHPVEQRGKNLSGGQKQRLSIARTLLRTPKLLILDDSTSALDNITTNKLLKGIKDEYDCTTVIISQKINSIKHADLILVLDESKIIGKGKHSELIENNDWYNKVYLNQLQKLEE
ncbi:ABC transporter ATP-binding protein [Mycoplasma crocodyli]|uniref:ABC transporter, ATP-binding protein n=1 Tax=Mycoplasma crocodyli (strain ATCC 51981 / MP145) TaxID=512564 RepID=D5E565_MYCCM|nr:ABC transporter ATP-binding protein [Mycoplasma crocodyli]ADE19490.1 ABC transporter, ATP-binding protein [Mycoplasma crocodyli MP145]